MITMHRRWAVPAVAGALIAASWVVDAAAGGHPAGRWLMLAAAVVARGAGGHGPRSARCG